MFYDKDIKIFFKEFAVDAFKNRSSFRILFDDKYNEMVAFSNTINVRDLSCFVSNEDIKKHKLKRNDVLIIEDEEYKISNIKREGTGISTLDLKYNEDDYNEDDYNEDDED